MCVYGKYVHVANMCVSSLICVTAQALPSQVQDNDMLNKFVHQQVPVAEYIACLHNSKTELS